MPFYQAQMEIKMASGVSADSVVNTLHFVGSTPATDAPLIETAMFSFYDDLEDRFSVDVAQSGHVLKVYNLDDVKPRAPILEETYVLPTPPSGASLPHECCVVMSFQADRASGVPQARRRNRIYFGPCQATMNITGGLVSTTLTGAINTAAQNLLAYTDTVAIDWVAYSPTDGTGDFVTNGWCDNTWDTQRRRGKDATLRNVWP